MKEVQRTPEETQSGSVDRDHRSHFCDVSSAFVVLVDCLPRTHEAIGEFASLCWMMTATFSLLLHGLSIYHNKAVARGAARAAPLFQLFFFFFFCRFSQAKKKKKNWRDDTLITTSVFEQGVYDRLHRDRSLSFGGGDAVTRLESPPHHRTRTNLPFQTHVTPTNVETCTDVQQL